MSRPAPAAVPPTDDIYKKMAVAATVFAVIFEAGYLATAAAPYDGLGYLIGRDFVNTWMGARSALAGGPAPWFDFDTYNAVLAAQFYPEFPHHNWSYPPHLLLITWPLAFLPYLPGYLVWCAIGMAVYLLAAIDGGRRKERLYMLAVAPAVWMNIFAGQNGFLTSALMIAGLAQLGRRPILSGVCFGLLTIKPQLGLLLPLMLLLTGQWRAIAAAVVTTAALVVATGLLFGFDIWPQCVRMVLPVQSEILTQGQGIFTMMMPTVFMNADRAFAARRCLDPPGRGIARRGGSGGVDILAPARPRAVGGAVRDRDVLGDALCVQLRHGGVRLGDRTSARTRQRAAR